MAAMTAFRAAEPVSFEEERAQFDAFHGAMPPADNCTIELIVADGVRGERITPRGADASRALLYHHGGGHTFGSALSHRHLVSRLAAAAGVVAFNMDYRLAPEHPYPAGLNDALATYRYVLGQGFTADQLVVGGESAGGNLTAALLLKLRALDLPLPAGAYLLSPWLDLTLAGESYEARAPHDPLITRAALDRCVTAYVGDGTAVDDPLVSPIKADLTGLPPLFIQVGTDELFLSDSTTFADRAALAGIDVELHVWAEMVHAWPLFHLALPVSGAAAIAEASAWIARQLAR
ncbi:alpha/beta hydrolase [Sphingopyxis sp. CCNWLW253]|uniref:alpha/beta hydrolase n=1 Tax=unclassified Sphingopyxis TaxID=2614943 RepID=UPI003012B574